MSSVRSTDPLLLFIAGSPVTAGVAVTVFFLPRDGKLQVSLRFAPLWRAVTPTAAGFGFDGAGVVGLPLGVVPGLVGFITGFAGVGVTTGFTGVGVITGLAGVGVITGAAPLEMVPVELTVAVSPFITKE